MPIQKHHRRSSLPLMIANFAVGVGRWGFRRMCERFLERILLKESDYGNASE